MTGTRGFRSGTVLPDLDALLAALRERGRVIAPVLREGAVMLAEIDHAGELPRGWVDDQEAGRHRLRREGNAYFGVTLAPESFKRYLFPPRLTLWRTAAGTLQAKAHVEAAAPFTLLGLRACDVAAVRVLDHVLLEGERVDADYRRRREAALLVTVTCERAAPTCFCVSTGTGPRVEAGFDLRLTELGEGFLLEAGSEAGAGLLDGLPGRPATEGDAAAAAAVEAPARRQRRRLPRGLETVLQGRLEDPRWAAVAERCLACGSCTQVCPTCFCSAAEPAVDLAGSVAEQRRRWDSCFASEHSYVHGGPVRGSRPARYRQWLTHKLATWPEQFGTPGCVGCGRCITWCPAAIDITQEARALARAPGAQEARALARAPGGEGR